MLVLKEQTVSAIKRWAKHHSSVEVVGMVWRHSDGQEVVRPMSNLHSQPDRFYTIDPEEMAILYRVMGAAGAEPIAFYHSHPNGKPDPSEADMEGALNVGMHYLIAYPEDSSVRPWRLSAWECIDMGILVGVELKVVS